MRRFGKEGIVCPEIGRPDEHSGDASLIGLPEPKPQFQRRMVRKLGTVRRDRSAADIPPHLLSEIFALLGFGVLIEV